MGENIHKEATITLGKWAINDEGQPYCVITMNIDGIDIRRLLKITNPMKPNDKDLIKAYCHNLDEVVLDDIKAVLGRAKRWRNSDTRQVNSIMEALGFEKRRSRVHMWKYIRRQQ